LTYTVEVLKRKAAGVVSDQFNYLSSGICVIIK